MALNALMQISTAKGESKNKNFPGWIELQGWDWEVECESSWTKGGGASVGKPNPGKMNWEHYFDTSSTTLLKFMCSGQAFERIELVMQKGTGGEQGQQVFFQMIMLGAFITKVSNSATDEGNVVQKVEMVFKDVEFHYFAQDDKTGKLGTNAAGGEKVFGWNIPSGALRGA
jgi:type VI secretion system secreted protein Hcp